ncbi:MAG: EutN/CcmL family microcompartment protein [Geminicoccaceae bacterium]
MRIARVIGTVTATVKASAISGVTLLVTDVEDGAGGILERAVVAADTCGAGVGDLVLLARGSAARLASNAAPMPIDAAVIAVIDHVELARPAALTPSSKKRKT